MARVSVSFKETTVHVISLFGGKSLLGRVQRADVSTDLPNTPVKELGNKNLVGRIFDLPTVSMTVGDITVGPRNLFLLAGKNWSAAAPGDVVTLDDFSEVCLALSMKSEKSDDIVRSCLVRGARLERISVSAAANGDFTTEYSFQANNDYRYLKYDIAVASGTVTSNVYTHSQNARQLSNNNYYLAVFASGVENVGYMTDDAIASSTANAVTFKDGEVADGGQVLVVYHKDLSDQWIYTYENPDIAAQPVGMRGFNVEIYLVKGVYTEPSFASQERILRCQNVTAQASFPINRIPELGTVGYVGYTEDIPDVTGTIEILDHDWKLMAQLSGDDSQAEDNYDANMLSTGDWGLYIKLWDRNVDRSSADPEMTIWIPTLDITGFSQSNQVAQDARTTINWASRESDMYFYYGNKP